MSTGSTSTDATGRGELRVEEGRIGEATGDGVKRGRGGEEEGVEGVDMREGLPTEGGEVERGWYLHMLLAKSLLAAASLCT